MNVLERYTPGDKLISLASGQSFQVMKVIPGYQPTYALCPEGDSCSILVAGSRISNYTLTQ